MSDIILNHLFKGEQNQERPDYVEMRRRFIADSKDFSDLNMYEVDVYNGFTNKDRATCVKEICKYINDNKEKEFI